MEFLTVSIALWGVVLYSLRVAVVGNPLYVMVRRATPDLLFRAEQVMREGRDTANDVERGFMRRVSRFMMLEFVAFAGEIGVLLYFLRDPRFGWIAGALLAKNVILLGVSFGFVRRLYRGDGMFDRFLNLPPWYVWTDRLSALASGLGLLAVFLAFNRVLRW